MASTEGETQISKADETNKEEKHDGNEEANQDPNFDPNEEYEEEKKEEGKDDQEEGKEDDQAGLDAHCNFFFLPIPSLIHNIQCLRKSCSLQKPIKNQYM